MKRVFTILAVVVLTSTWFLTQKLNAQAPQKMSYQAIIRDGENKLLTTAGVGVRISILQGSPTGTVVYQEIFIPVPVTNENGLLTIEIGEGVAISGVFSDIDWSAGPYFLMNEIDPGGGTSYSLTSTTQLLSVPYALYAEHAGTSGQPGPAGIVATGYISGFGYNPQATLNFVTDPVTVEITSTTQKVFWTASKAFGSTVSGGASDLRINPAYRLVGATSVSTVGGWIYDLRCAQNTRQTYSLSGVVTGLAPGMYEFGMGAECIGTPANWNYNEYGYVSYILME
jgi:hypothetical protein